MRGKPETFLFLMISTVTLSLGCSNPLGQSSMGVGFHPGISSNSSFTDQDDSLTGFGGGTGYGTAWDATNNYLRLGNAGGCDATSTNCAELDSSWTPNYSKIVGYWKLNEGIGAPTVADSSGNANTGVVEAGTTLGVAGKLNTAGSFNGTATGYIDAGNNPVLRITGDITLSAWVKPTNYTNHNGLIEKAVGAVAAPFDWYLLLTTGIPQFFRGNGVASSSVPATLAPPIGVWSHIAVVMSGTTVTHYLNGQVNGTGTIVTATTDGGTDVFLGSRNDFLPKFTGGMDELVIWNTPLTSSQVQTIYSRQSAKYAGTFQSRVMDFGVSDNWLSFNWGPTLPFFKELPDSTSGVPQSETSSNYPSSTNSLMNKIVGLWHLDETGGTTAYDNSGNSVSGTYALGYTLGQPGKFLNAPLLNGTNGYIMTGNLIGLFTNTDLSLSIWFKANGAGVIVSELGQATINTSWHDSQIEILNTGQVKISVWEGSVFNLPLGTVSFGQWNHVVLRYNTSTTFLDGFLNGVKIAGVVGAREYPNNSLASAYYYALGATDSTNLGSGAYFNGIVDEFAIWSRPITDAEALELYRRGANRMKYQIRVCGQPGCVDNPSWLGTDGTNQSYFTELNTNIIPSDGGDPHSTDFVLTTLPNMLFSTFTGSGLIVPYNRHFQYRSILESDDSNNLCNYGSGSVPCSAELKKVTVVPQ